ncbi:MAG: glycosyltransferase family 4 protein [Deltaproteobacteria bacterium]|nr:glycosyltransferase family 4 protein [Deltaproteobacteria bacterium]
MTKKTIAILDTGREWGGGTNSMLELVARIDKKRYRLKALFYDNYPKGKSSTVKAELERLGVEFILLRRPQRLPYSKAVREAGRALFFFSPSLKKRFVFSRDYRERIVPAAIDIADVLKKTGADLLYLNNQPSSNLEGILAAGSLGLPCVQHSRAVARLNASEAGAVNAAVSKIICVSSGVRDALVESGVEAGRCVVVYNGIDKDAGPLRDAREVRSSLGIVADTFLIGTVGSLLKRKRTALLIDALPFLKKGGKNACPRMSSAGVRCLIVGDGPEMVRLKEKAKRLGVEDMVVFAGFSNDALSLANCLDLFILPSEGEGLPRVILEAMLLSKPVVAFDVSGVREVVDDGVTGLILKKEGGEAIASSVKELMSGAARMKAMGEAGRARVIKEFAIDRYAAGVMRVFEEVVP